MNQKLQIIRTTDFIKTTHKGEVDLVASKQTLASIANASRGVEEYEFLIDNREAVSRHSLVDAWQVASELSNYDQFRGRKFAILVSDTWEQADFFKMCARNRGYWVDFFRDFESAVNWLFSATDVPSEIPTERPKTDGQS